MSTKATSGSGAGGRVARAAASDDEEDAAAADWEIIAIVAGVLLVVSSIIVAMWMERRRRRRLLGVQPATYTYEEPTAPPTHAMAQSAGAAPTASQMPVAMAVASPITVSQVLAPQVPKRSLWQGLRTMWQDSRQGPR